MPLRHTNPAMISLSLLDSTWASSEGGPGLKFAEHNAGRSMLGTRKPR